MNISLDKAKQNKLFYFVVTGIIFHPQKSCLFDDFAWVDVVEVEKYKTIDGIKEEVKKTIVLMCGYIDTVS